jgi:hypothetical protein
MSGFENEEAVTQLAAAVGLPIPPEYREGVRQNMQQLARLAELVGEGPLDDSADEPATAFVPR